MNKLALALITAVSVLCLTTLAFAGSLAPGASMSCKDAKSIKLTSAGTHAHDRANANFVIWKSSNFTTIPISLGPSDTSGLEVTVLVTRRRRSLNVKIQLSVFQAL